MNLDELHQVMKGDMTIDRLFDGRDLTDDFEIGHVSHRADGDYRKVAQGKWVPVSVKQQMANAREDYKNEQAQKIAQKKEQIAAMEKHRDEHPENAKGWQEEIDKVKAEIGEKPAEQKGGGTESDGPEKIEGLSDRWTIKSGIDSAGNMRYTLYDNGQERSSSLNKDDVVQMAKWQEEIEEKYSKKKEPKAEGGKRQLKRNANGTPIYETPEDVIYDMVENYNELDRGDLQGVIEAAAMSHGWDENEILEEVDRQAAEKYNLGVDSAAPRLTRDTKIRLSKIKKKITQDKAYNVGEISHRKDGDWKKVAPGKWAPVKAGGDKSQETVNKQDQIDMMHTVSEYFDEESETNPNLSDKPTLAKIYQAIKEGKDTSKFNQHDVDGLKSWMGMGDKDEPEGDEDPLSDNVGIRNLQKRGYDLTKLELRADADGNWGVYNKGSGYGLGITIAGSILNEETAKKAGLTVKGGGSAGATKPAAEPKADGKAGTKKTYEGSGSTKGHKWEAEKVGDKYISTHTWPDGRTDKTEITQKDYETMRTTQGGKSEAPKPASSKPSSELKYYEDMGDRVEELRSQMTTAGPEEKRRLISESVDLQRRMQTAPFRPKRRTK